MLINNLLIHHLCSYFLIPLCVHVVLPFLKVSDELKTFLKSPIHSNFQNIHYLIQVTIAFCIFFTGMYIFDASIKKSSDIKLKNN